MLTLHPPQLLGEGVLGHGGQDRDAVLGPLAVPDDDLVHPEVDVLDPQAATFQQAQAGAIEQGGHEPGRAVQLGDDRAHLVARQDDGEVFRAPGSDHVLQPGPVLVQDVTVELIQSALRVLNRR